MSEVVTLQGKLDIAAVNDLYARLTARLDQDVVLELGQVTHLGALCLQTLIAAGVALRAEGHCLRMHGVSAEVDKQLRSMGASQHLICEGAQ